MPDSIGAEQYPSFEERAEAKAKRDAERNQTLYKCLSYNGSIWSNNDNSGICEICGKPRSGTIGDVKIAAKDREVAAAGLGCDPAWLHKNKTCGISTTQAQNYLLHKLVTTQRKALEALWKISCKESNEGLAPIDHEVRRNQYHEWLNSDTLTQFIQKIQEMEE